MINDRKVSVALGFEEVSIPPFRDILVLAKKCPHGRNGLSKCMSLLAPDEFEVIEMDKYTDDGEIEAILVNRKILNKVSITDIIDILQAKVFPYVERGEIVKVDFKVKVEYNNIIIK